MRRIYTFLIVSFFCFNSLIAQNFTSIKIGYERNLDLVKFTETAKLFIDQGNDVRSSTQKLEVFYTSPLFKSNWNGGIGVSYKLIKHHVYDYFYYSSNLKTADLESISNSIGLKAELNLTVHRSKLFTGNIGINTEWYLFEFYSSRFVGSGGKFSMEPSPTDTPRNFFLSSSNLSAFYRCEWLSPKSNLNVALKISVGTNLYSDWDQFKRYVWIGIGGEIGVRTHKKETMVLPK